MSNKVSITSAVTYKNSSNSQLVKLQAQTDHLTLVGSSTSNAQFTCGELNCTGGGKTCCANTVEVQRHVSERSNVIARRSRADMKHLKSNPNIVIKLGKTR